MKADENSWMTLTLKKDEQGNWLDGGRTIFKIKLLKSAANQTNFTRLDKEP